MFGPPGTLSKYKPLTSPVKEFEIFYLQVQAIALKGPVQEPAIEAELTSPVKAASTQIRNFPEYTQVQTKPRARDGWPIYDLPLTYGGVD